MTSLVVTLKSPLCTSFMDDSKVIEFMYEKIFGYVKKTPYCFPWFRVAWVLLMFHIVY